MGAGPLSTDPSAMPELDRALSEATVRAAVPDAGTTLSGAFGTAAEGRIVETGGTERLLLAEEIAEVDVRQVVTERVRVRTEVETARETARADLALEEVTVERVPVDRIVAEAPATRVEGDVTIVPVCEEVLVVEKRLVLREEVHIRRTRRVEAVEVPVDLRRTKAVVERIPVNEAATDALTKD